MKGILLLLAWAGPLLCFPQTPLIDSLLSSIYQARTEKDRLHAILLLSEQYNNLNRDTLDKYAYIARDLAQSNGSKADKAAAGLSMAYMYWRWGWADSTLAAIDESLVHVPVTDPAGRDIYFRLMRQKALALGGSNRLQEALEVLYKLVGDAEKYNDPLVAAASLNTIGSVSLARNKPAEALDWLRKALGFSTHDNRFHSIESAVYINMAEAYDNLNRRDSAVYYIKKGIALCKESGSLETLSIALQRQSNIFMAAGKLPEAEKSLMDMMEVRKQLKDPGMWVDENLTLANFYIESGQIDKAIAFCLDNLRQGDRYNYTGETAAVMTNNIRLRLGYYEALARCFRIKGDAAGYTAALENIIAAKDSMYEANSAEAIAALQTQYEVQKKETTIIQQQYSLLKKDYLLYGVLAFLALSAAAGGIIFTGYRKREKLRTEMMLRSRKEEADKAVAQAEEAERRRIAADLHDNLGAYAASIVSNLEFIGGDFVQEQQKTALRELKHNSLSIVSQLSDTIWVLNKEALYITSIGDRIKGFANRLESSFPGFSIQVSEKIGHDILLPSFRAFDLYQIAKEALNNALRHSKGDRIEVLLVSGDFWEMSITDNGTGMPQVVGHGEGNGLANIRRRAAEAGWFVSWAPAAGGGTCFRVSSTSN